MFQVNCMLDVTIDKTRGKITQTSTINDLFKQKTFFSKLYEEPTWR